jgi:mRNA interferase MazF
MTGTVAGLIADMNAKSINYPKRGEIWQVSLEPVVGHEIGKARPALIISNDKNNEYSSTVTLIPITGSIEKIYPFEVFISRLESGLPLDSKLKCNQIRTVDKSRLLKVIGEIPEEIISKVEKAVLIHLEISESAI